MRQRLPLFSPGWGFFRLVCAAALVFCLLGGSASAHPVLRVAYPQFWPFFERTEHGEMTGFFYEIATQALGRMGIQAVWEAFPWSRCQARVRLGESDAMITVPTAERLTYCVTHNDPFYLKKLNIFTYSGHPSLDDIEAIESVDDIKRLGLTVVTYHGNGWNDTHILARGIKVYEAPLIKSTWRMLASRRGDIAIEWPGAAWPMIRDGGVSAQIIQTEAHLEAMPFHLLIGRDSSYADRIEEFNAVILQMKEEGEIDRIVGKYIVKP